MMCQPIFSMLATLVKEYKYDNHIIEIYENSNKDRYYYRDGKLHRDDGPAIEYENGDKSWYKNAIIHRADGPAVEWETNTAWFIDGVEYSEEIYNRLIKILFLI